MVGAYPSPGVLTAVIVSSIVISEYESIGSTPFKLKTDIFHLGPVNTMRISIDGGHFFTGQGALSAVYLPYISESATRSWGKMAPSLRVGPPMRPSGVAHRSFGAAKLRSARLAWPHWRANAGYPHSVNRP